MKIVHIADTHPDRAACTRLDPESGMNLREKQIYDNFHKLTIDEFIRQNPGRARPRGRPFDTVKPKTRVCMTMPGRLT